MPKKNQEFPGRAYVQKNLPQWNKKVKESLNAARKKAADTVNALGDLPVGRTAKAREILPAAAWGLMETVSRGKHSKLQNQKLSDKVDDALGRPVRPARAKRAGLTPKGTVAQKGSKKKGT